MIIMTTLGNAFPKVWEEENEGLKAYFSTNYSHQKIVASNFKLLPDEKKYIAAIGRYASLDCADNVQNFAPSALLVTSIEVLEEPASLKNKKYDIEVQFLFLGKITDEKICQYIEGIQKTPLLQELTDHILEEVVLQMLPVPEMDFDIDDVENEEMEYEPCPECDGSGSIDCECFNSGSCETCGGMGEYICPLCQGTGGYRPISQD